MYVILRDMSLLTCRWSSHYSHLWIMKPASVINANVFDNVTQCTFAHSFRANSYRATFLGRRTFRIDFLAYYSKRHCGHNGIYVRFDSLGFFYGLSRRWWSIREGGINTGRTYVYVFAQISICVGVEWKIVKGGNPRRDVNVTAGR